MPKLSVIIPCYYNEDNIPVTARELVANEANFPPEVAFEYMFVNDGSGDDTLRRSAPGQAVSGQGARGGAGRQRGLLQRHRGRMAQPPATAWPSSRPTCRTRPN